VRKQETSKYLNETCNISFLYLVLLLKLKYNILTDPPTMTNIYTFKNILHDAWLDFHGPYSRRPPAEDEARQELYAQLDDYFKNECSGEWINIFKPLASYWVFNGSLVISDIKQVSESFNDETPKEQRVHYQVFLGLAEWLKNYA